MSYNIINSFITLIMIHLIQKSIVSFGTNNTILTESAAFVGPIHMRLRHHMVERSPRGYRNFLIPEPFRGHLADICRIHMRNPCRNFRTRNHPIQIRNLNRVRPRHVEGIVPFEQLIPVTVASTVDFHWVDLNLYRRTY